MKNESQIAVNLFNLRDYCQNEKDFAKTLEQLKNIGFSLVQVSAVPLKAEIIRKHLDEFELSCCATHGSYEQIFDDVNKVCDWLDILDCDYIALGSSPELYRSHLGMKQLAYKFNNQAEKMLSRKKKLAYHNHEFEFERKGGDCTIFETFYNNTDANLVQAELDVQWVARAGASPVSWIKNLKNKLDVIHFKDFTIVDMKPVICEVGEGNLDWTSIVAESKNNGVKFYSIEQDFAFMDRNIFDSMKISFDNMKKMGLE